MSVGIVIKLHGKGYLIEKDILIVVTKAFKYASRNAEYCTAEFSYKFFNEETYLEE